MIDKKMSIEEVVTKYPETIAVFERAVSDAMLHSLKTFSRERISTA
jgi:hypothetical protein